MTKKCVALGLTPSFGFGDRTGLATPGHVASMKRCGEGIAAIYPQQSIREMTRTQRTPQGVMDDAMSAAEAAGWGRARLAADADHLKIPNDVDITAAVGFHFLYDRSFGRCPTKKLMTTTRQRYAQSSIAGGATHHGTTSTLAKRSN